MYSNMVDEYGFEPGPMEVYSNEARLSNGRQNVPFWTVLGYRTRPGVSYCRNRLWPDRNVKGDGAPVSKTEEAWAKPSSDPQSPLSRTDLRGITDEEGKDEGNSSGRACPPAAVGEVQTDKPATTDVDRIPDKEGFIEETFDVVARRKKQPFGGEGPAMTCFDKAAEDEGQDNQAGHEEASDTETTEEQYLLGLGGLVKMSVRRISDTEEDAGI